MKSTVPIEKISMDHPRSLKGNNPIIAIYQAYSASDEISDYFYYQYGEEIKRKRLNFRLPIKGTIVFSEDFIPVRYNLNINTDSPMLQYKGNCVCSYFYTQAEIASSFRISGTMPHTVEFKFEEYWHNCLDISLYSEYQEGNMAFLFKFFYTVRSVVSNQEYDIGIVINSTNILESGKQYYESTEDTNVYLPYIYIKWG